VTSNGKAAKGQDMNSHWQEQLLALVARYGEQCSQMATERARGIHEHPPADRAGAWAAILSHLARAQQPADTTQTAGSA
jgi:hypothetical protein